MLWRLRRSTSIETGLYQIQGELMRNRNVGIHRRRNVPLPEWYGELDVVALAIDGSSVDDRGRDDTSGEPAVLPQTLAYCFLQVSRLGLGAFDLLSRYETTLRRQVAQIQFVLQSAARR